MPKWNDNENTTLNVKNDITNWSVISAHSRWTVTEKPLTLPSLTILTSYTSFSDSKGYLTHIDWQWRITYTPFRDRLLNQSENLQINSTYKKAVKTILYNGRRSSTCKTLSLEANWLNHYLQFYPLSCTLYIDWKFSSQS